MARFQNRDKMSGRWMRVDTSNTPLSDSPTKFDRITEYAVDAQGSNPADLAYDVTGRAESNAGPRYDAPTVKDNLGVGGSPLRARRPDMVSAEDAAATIYGSHDQGQVVRAAAARGSRDVIPGTDIEQDASRRLTGRE